jgi:hypothetical protein
MKRGGIYGRTRWINSSIWQAEVRCRSIRKWRRRGFGYALKPESTVLLRTRRRHWNTSKERLAALAGDGRHGALVHVRIPWTTRLR